jgi:hypothetical protein
MRPLSSHSAAHWGKLAQLVGIQHASHGTAKSPQRAGFVFQPTDGRDGEG